jgi:hypothetical protein
MTHGVFYAYVNKFCLSAAHVHVAVNTNFNKNVLSRSFEGLGCNYKLKGACGFSGGFHAISAGFGHRQALYSVKYAYG